MKKIQLTLIMILMGTVISLAQTNSDKAVKAVAKKFVKAADVQDPEMLASVLYEDALQFVLFGPKVMKSTGSEYVEMIKAKKLGGVPRTVSFKHVAVQEDDTATVSLEAVSSEYHFIYHLNLFKVAGEWKLYTINTRVNPVNG